MSAYERALAWDRQAWPNLTKKRSGVRSVALRKRVYERDGHTCVSCGATKGLTLDHIVPRSKGGLNTYDNLQVMCGPCNQRKADR